jgi:hypothetical protein
MTLQILNYGGGWQTTGMLVLIEQGKLPRPDRIIIADTGREKGSTWEYLERTARPRMQAIGLDIEVAPRALAKVDIYSHQGDLLLPAYTLTGKLPAFCSNEWKQRVVARYLGHPKDVRHWIGFTFDERKRIKDPTARWFPLVEMMLTKADIRAIVRAAGWPDPTSSACYMCANLDNAEWCEIRDNRPDEFELACVLDEEIREEDLFKGGTGVWLHHSRVPLREADLAVEDRKGPARQCGLGMCFI